MLPALAMRGWHCTLGPAPGKIWRGCHDKDGPLQIPESFGMRPREPLHQETAVFRIDNFLRTPAFTFVRAAALIRIQGIVAPCLRSFAEDGVPAAYQNGGALSWFAFLVFLLATPIVLMCHSAWRICLTLCFGLVGVGCSISEECLDPTCAGQHHKIAIQKEESCRHDANDASMLMCDKLHIPLNSGLFGATACTASEHHHAEE